MVNIIFDKKRQELRIVVRGQDDEPRNYYC